MNCNHKPSNVSLAILCHIVSSLGTSLRLSNDKMVGVLVHLCFCVIVGIFFCHIEVSLETEISKGIASLLEVVKK